MRKVEKDFNAVPPELKASADMRKEDGFESEKTGRFKSEYYKLSREKLRELYHEKCAYCESELLISDYDTVEHYRPKNKNGYFWLAYEWSNLLLACNICNNAKGARFQLQAEHFDHRSIAVGELPYLITDYRLRNEEPMLLNPEVDDPDYFLAYDNNGKLKPNHNQPNTRDRAEYTIDLCKLNRDKLRKKRKGVIDQIFNSLSDQAYTLVETHKSVGVPIESLLAPSFKNIFKQIKVNSESPSLSYTMIHRAIYSDFELLLLTQISSNIVQRIVGKAFRLFKAGKL